MTSTLLVKLPAWQALEAHHEKVSQEKMRDWFAQDSERFARFSLRFGGLLFDYSKNRVTPETMQLLVELAKAVDLPAKIQALFSAEPVNTTEGRPALHMALRNQDSSPFWVKQKNVTLEVQQALEKMRGFVEKVQAGHLRGATGKTLRDIVNIGIGGSHLGPLMTTQAFAAQAKSDLRFYFISDVDSVAIQEVWQQLDPERTLFIVSSKSFTTVETLINAKTCYAWLQERLQGQALSSHFVAVTAQLEKAKHWGIPEEQIFPIWDWVGGRYSVWSAIGLPLALQMGMDGFQAFLEGAYSADQHFLTTELSQNIPVIMGLLSVWYVNFFQATTQAIIPYAHSLKYLRAYLQQLDMESNGKRITQQGEEASYSTGPIIWGELGIHGQHAFHQLLHQGTHLVPVDFLLVGQQYGLKAGTPLAAHQDMLIANALSQARALMQGKKAEEFTEELSAEALSPKDHYLAKHKEIPGNRPSSIFFMDQLTPETLGALLVFYEHKIFVQSVIWNVNPFDQWGVELGKAILPAVLEDLDQDELAHHHDSSTRQLILHYKRLRETT
jgi:glucose-6-phosphate isomerase